MKRIISAILMAAMLFCFAACTPVSEDSIQPAVYKLKDELYPRIYLREDKTYMFLITPSSSANTKGTYSVSDGILKLETSEGTVYCFDIKKDALIFDGELSDEIIKTHKDDHKVVDGTEFELWHKAIPHSSTTTQ